MVPLGTDVPTPIIEPLRTEQFDPIPCPHVPVDIPRVVIARLMRFLKDKGDGLYYTNVRFIGTEKETVNAATILSDDDEPDGNKKGGKDKEEDDDDEEEEDLDDGDKKPEAKQPEQVDINRAHEILKHPGEIKLKQQAKQFNWKLTGTLLCCEHCSKSKVTAKPTKKETEKKAEAPGTRLYMDKSGPYKLTRGKNRQWLLVVDLHTKRAWSFFATQRRTPHSSMDWSSVNSRPFGIREWLACLEVE